MKNTEDLLEDMLESIQLTKELIENFGILRGRDLLYNKEDLIKLKEECKLYKELFETKSPELLFSEQCFEKVKNYLLNSLTEAEKVLILSNKKILNDKKVSNKCLNNLKYSEKANTYYFYIKAKDKQIPVYICWKNIKDLIGGYAGYLNGGICIACKHEEGLYLSDIEFIIDNEGLLIHEFIHDVDNLKKGIGLNASEEEYYNDEKEFHANLEMFINWLDKYMTRERGFMNYYNRINELLVNGITKIDKKYVYKVIYDEIYNYDKFSYEDRPYELTRKTLMPFFTYINDKHKEIVMQAAVDHINDLLQNTFKINSFEKDEDFKIHCNCLKETYKKLHENDIGYTHDIL